MGTNYYANTNVCQCCNRFDRVHLGKNSGGWAFSFQASESVRTFDDWCRLVRNADQIEDEYGRFYSADQMIAMAQSWQDGKKHAALYPSPHDWLDEHGYSFSLTDFS